MLEGDGKPKSINLNRILFFFFVLCFSFKLFFFNFPRRVAGSASGTFHIRRIFPSFLTHLLQISLLLLFFSFFFFPSSFSPRNQLHHPFNSDGGSCTHTLIRQLN